MEKIKSKIINKLERLFMDKLVPRLVIWGEYIQTKTRKYRHQQIKNKLKFCGEGVRFKRDLKIDYPENVSLGHRVYIGSDVLLDGRGGITIGDNTTVGFNVVILSANHDYQSNDLPYQHNIYIHKPVTIGRNVWIAGNVLIVPGVSIGDGAIIAAGTVVTGNIEPLAIVGNQPMRVIKYRDKEHYEHLAKKQETTNDILVNHLEN